MGGNWGEDVFEIVMCLNDSPWCCYQRGVLMVSSVRCVL